MWRKRLREILEELEKQKNELDKVVEELKRKGINPDVIADEVYQIKKAINNLKQFI